MQAAIFAIRNICENNEDNKKFIEEMKKEGKIVLNKINVRSSLFLQICVQLFYPLISCFLLNFSYFMLELFAIARNRFILDR